MEPFAELIAHEIDPEPARVNEPAAHLLTSPLPTNGTERPPRTFEISVFNALLAQRATLGVTDVWRCRNVRIDGLLDLADGRRLALEIKYRMNWEKACQAGAQFSWYRKRRERSEKPLSGALVFFEEFSGDWARRKPAWLLENGWNYWYTEQNEVDGLRIDLVRLRGGKLDSYRTELAKAQLT
jgi:hypothetical protein